MSQGHIIRRVLVGIGVANALVFGLAGCDEEQDCTCEGYAHPVWSATITDSSGAIVTDAKVYEREEGEAELPAVCTQPTADGGCVFFHSNKFNYGNLTVRATRADGSSPVEASVVVVPPATVRGCCAPRPPPTTELKLVLSP
jgi:hypothetical protein